MKRLYIILFFMLFMLSGCLTIIDNEDSDEYRALSNQYETYVTNDITQVDQFESFVNETTFTSMMSNVMIKIQIFSDLHNLVETRYGSGVIFAVGAYNYVLTTFELTDIPSNLLVTYQVADYQGRTTSAYIDKFSEDYGLAVLKFRRILSNHLPAIEFADQNSLLGEPVLLFGYIEEIMNSMSMGLVEETNSESNILDEYVYTTIESDIYANGSAVIDINNQLIGIQAGVSEGLSYAISITNIMEFLELYTDYQELD